MTELARPVSLDDLIEYSRAEGYRAGIVADAMRHDTLMRQAARSNEHRARMMSAISTLCLALSLRDRELVAKFITEGIPT
jgi:hypothetical protein